ncbi:ABC transporter permease [Xanthobacter tagetidis]|uniref:ABC transporter permease n=1 Tax=Xanthobacter tagetidis TaxID=60216 RepID=A0A3L7ACC8_9HYPH|nr:ABC transporter permease [Xanthobacter tagetidis]
MPATAVSPSAASAPRIRRGPWLPPRALGLLTLAALLLAWEVLPRLELVPPVLVAPLSTVLESGVASAGTFAEAMGVTMVEIAFALVFAYGVGGILGLVLGSVKPLRGAVLPLVSSIYAVPFIVAYPLLTAWIGIGMESKVIFAGIYGMFPMILATAAGVRTVDPAFVRAARSMGATRAQILFQVLVPAAFPSILSGLRIAGSLVTIGVVVAEMLASTAGLGFLITQYRSMFQTPEVYFGIILVLCLTGFLDFLIGCVERKAAAWRPRKELI